jgi:hypothetical protein
VRSCIWRIWRGWGGRYILCRRRMLGFKGREKETLNHALRDLWRKSFFTLIDSLNHIIISSSSESFPTKVQPCQVHDLSYPRLRVSNAQVYRYASFVLLQTPKTIESLPCAQRSEPHLLWTVIPSLYLCLSSPATSLLDLLFA